MESGIKWTDRTWNPIVGCSVTSPGCANCYAMKDAGMKSNHPNPKIKDIHRGLTEVTNGNVVWTGKTRFRPDKLKKVNTKKPTMWLVNSMGDLFQESVGLDVVKTVFQAMNDNPQHIFQILTKQTKRLLWVADKLDWTENIWMGVSVEDDRVLDRIDHLRKVPAHIRFVCFEPLLGPVPNVNLEGIKWVIAGGESGPDHRPIRKSWVEDIRDQCIRAEIAFFFKQWGGKTPKANGKTLGNHEWQDFPIDVSKYNMGGLTDIELAVVEEKLGKLAESAKAQIKEAENGLVNAYFEAGNKLIAAKKENKKTGRSWLEWLESKNIAARTASRAMSYARNPEKYREDRIKDVQWKAKESAKIGQNSGRKLAILRGIRKADDSDIDILDCLIAENSLLARLKGLINEEVKKDRPVPALEDHPSPEISPPQSSPVPASEDHTCPEASSAGQQHNLHRNPDSGLLPLVSS